MTGNTSKWRAPLAGLASIAMLATMGVAASTANALSPADNGAAFGASLGKATVNVYDAAKPYQKVDQFTRNYGDVIEKSDVDLYADAHKVLDYLSYDKAGANKVATPYVVTGDVKLYAHSKDAVKVTFDKDGNPATTGDRVSTSIAKGTGLTAEEYAEVGGDALAAAKSGYQFAGWTTEGTLDSSTSDALYTGAALDSDTVLYARYAKAVSSVNTGKDLAVVYFRQSIDAASSADKTLYTLNNHAFPAFRAPSANGTWKKSVEAAAYDFNNTPVSNTDGVANPADPDLTLYNVTSTDGSDVTIRYHFQGATPTDSDYATTNDATIKAPVAPVKAGAVFTGWYKTKSGAQSEAWDFNKSVKDNFTSASGNVDLWAGWDYTNVSKLTFELGYQDFDNDAFTGSLTAEQVLFVRPGATVTLPQGLEEYYQTEAQKNANKGEYTSRKLAGWYVGSSSVNTVTKFTARDAKSVTKFTAKWTGASSIKLIANGGKFDGNAQVKWVTKDDGQKWQDVVTAPTSDQGGKFVQWRNNETYYGKAEGTLRANLSDGNWYEISTGNIAGPIADGNELKAEWGLGAAIDIDGYRNQFSLRFGNANESADVLTVEAYGYTADSAKAYVKAVNALEDEYQAYLNKSGQDKIDAAKALAAKYEAAQKLLVKSNGAEVPSGKVAVYRAFNPNAKNAGSHLYTTDFAEYSKLVRLGWTAEGVQFQTTSSKDATPLYRVYNKTNGAHHYTADLNEKNTLVKKGWVYEDVAWYVDAKAPVAVYRAYNPNTGEHVYTTDEAEYQGLTTRHGWDAEKVAFQAWAK